MSAKSSTGAVMDTALVPVTDAIELALVTGDLSRLTSGERVSYYNAICASLGLNPLTKPFAYITLNGKLTLYALKDCTEQLRSTRTVSVQIVAREAVEDCYVVTARATLPNGRQDESVGAVPLGGLKGEARANALMKAETKAKRRVTLSICGLGILDETEVESVPGARRVSSEPVAAQPVGVLSGAAFEEEPPNGFAAWWAEFQALAPNGREALEAAWKAGGKSYRSYANAHHRADIDALKEAATERDAIAADDVRWS